MKPLLVYPSRWSIGFMLLVSAIWGHGSYTMFRDIKPLRTADRIGATLFGVLAASGLASATLTVAKRKPILMLTAAGLHDTRLEAGVIPWEEIEQVYLEKQLFYQQVYLTLFHPAHYPQGKSWLGRFWSGHGRLIGELPFTIQTIYTDITASELADAIYQWQISRWAKLNASQSRQEVASHNPPPAQPV